MANMQRMGGIGAGVMQGLQFMRQRESDARQNQALENQNQQLQMNQQIHSERMGALNRENEERQRAESLGKLHTQIESVYGQGPDALPEYDRQKMYIEKALGTGLIKPAELDTAKKTYDGMVKLAGVDAFDAAVLRKDVAPLQKLFSSRGMGNIAYDPKADAFSFTPPGATAPQSLDRKGLLQIGIMSAARDRELARAEAELKTRKTEAEITNLDSKTSLNNRLPQERVGGSGRGAGGKEPKPYDPISTLEDFNKAIGNNPENNQPYPWAQTALQHYQQMVGASPDVASTREGGQYLLNLATALGRGEAKAIPEIDANGNAMLVASWGGGRKMPLQKSIDVSDLSQVQGVGGRPIVSPDEWVQIQGNALRTYASKNPGEYRLAAAASADPAAMDALAQRAQENPSAARAYNFAKITQELGRLQKTVGEGSQGKRQDPGAEATAKALGIDPNAPGVVDRVSGAANRFLQKASGVVRRGAENNFDSQLRMLQRNPSDRAVKEWLIANSEGRPDLQKRIQDAMATK